MTTIVERTYAVEGSPEVGWELIADPGLRARAISVVERFEERDDETIWHLTIPVRAIPGTITVRTRDIERNPPTYVRFRGESRTMTVEGEHELTATEDGCTIRNRFEVQGKLPGVERYFEREFDTEIRNMMQTIIAEL